MNTLFKPNKGGTGILVDFGIQGSRKEKNKSGLYLKLVKQCGPMSAPFANAKQKATIKFNELELCSMINSLEKRSNWTTVHKQGSAPGRSITFNVLFKKDAEGNPTKEFSGFAFNTSLGADKFGFTLNVNECVLVRELFKWALQNHLFNGRYAEEKARIKESMSAKPAPIEEEVAAIVEELDEAALED